MKTNAHLTMCTIKSNMSKCDVDILSCSGKYCSYITSPHISKYFTSFPSQFFILHHKRRQITYMYLHTTHDTTK